MNQINELKMMIEIPFFYNEKPYLVTTQNQSYIAKILPENVKNACCVLGAGDSVFELSSKGVENITAVDINPHQTFVYHLRKASILTLEPKEFEGFLVDSNRKIFLSPDVFKIVREGFTVEEEESRKICEYLFSHYSSRVLGDNLFKTCGGFIKLIRQSLPYIKNKTDFYHLKEQLQKVKISLVNGDILTYFLNHPKEMFEYIDITNVLLFIYQMDCGCNEELFRKKIEQLRVIYEQNLSVDGVFVLDYFFGNSIRSLFASKAESSNVQGVLKGARMQDVIKNYKQYSKQKVSNIYRETYLLLKEMFELEIANEKRQIDTFGKEKDTIVYTKKA